MEVTSSLFYKNIKSVPTPDSEEYLPFFLEEKNKIENGVTIDGVFFSGWLYWHLNHWKIYFDKEDEYKNIRRTFERPQARDNEFLAAEYLERARIAKKGLCIFGSRRYAKALKHGSKVYYKDKEGTIENVKVGDKIFGADGKLTKVTSVNPQGVKDLYEITFLDGRKVTCCGEHLWKVFDKQTGTYKIVDTNYLFPRHKNLRIHNGYAISPKHIYETRFAIPLNSPVEYEEQPVKIDPYLFGLLLGDGSSYRTQITSVDEEIIQYCKKYCDGNNLILKKEKGSLYSYSMTSGNRGGNKKENRTKNVLHTALKELDYYNNKHIPKNYLYNSFENRLALLQGIFDTDGTITKSGNMSITSSNPILTKDIEFLVRSLGCGCRVTEKSSGYTINGEKKECKNTFLISIYTELPICRLKRKLERQKLCLKGKQPKINKVAIVDIKKVESDYATCITVDNNDKLFLTDDFIVTHNSEIEASWLGRIGTMFKGSENILVGSNEPDIRLLTDKLDKGLNSLHPFFKHGRIDDNWKKEVTLGYKDQITNERNPWSKFLIRNTKGGLETEVIAGATPTGFVFDEIGKARCLEVMAAAFPSFTGPYGWRVLPLLTGTGGSFENGEDAQELFENPTAYNFLSVEIPEKHGKTYGLFIPGTYRMEAKEKTTIGDYFNIENKNSFLYQEPFYKKNDEKAISIIKEEIKKAKEAKDPKAELKARMYFPLDVDDCFLTDSGNEFPIELLKAQLARVEAQGELGQSISLYIDIDGKVKHKPSEKKAVFDFPVKPSSYKEGTIIMYELPVTNAPYGLYIAGNDPYKHSQAKYSNSVGATYIYKRIHTITGEGYQDTLVAHYCGRPDKIETWYENTRLLLKFYNAMCLCENDDYNFIQYMIGLNEAEQYLFHKPEFIKTLIPNSSSKREYGVNATDKLINFLHGNIKKYLTEVIDTQRDENGNIKKQILGVSRINDPMLLKELIAYNSNFGNYDRIRAFGLALTQAMSMTNIGPVEHDTTSSIEESYMKSYRRKPSPFIKTKSPFKTKTQWR